MLANSAGLVMVAVLAIVAAGLAASGCKRGKAGASEFAPATGKDAPPRPALPELPSGKDSKDKAGEVSTVSNETTGTTYPRAKAEVAPNASGVIAQVAVEEGDIVKKGALLFRLRSEDYTLRVKQAAAALESARVRLAAVKVEYDRTQRLFESKAINQAAWDQIQAEYRGTEVGVEQAKVAVAMAQKALADTTVRSPISGVITAKIKNAGEMATMMPPSVVVVVEDQSTLELRFRLPERSLQTIKPGDLVHAEFSALNVTVEAKIARISAAVDPRTRTVEVIALLPNAEGQLRSGMLASVKLTGDAGASL